MALSLPGEHSPGSGKAPCKGKVANKETAIEATLPCPEVVDPATARGKLR